MAHPSLPLGKVMLPYNTTAHYVRVRARASRPLSLFSLEQMI